MSVKLERENAVPQASAWGFLLAFTCHSMNNHDEIVLPKGNLSVRQHGTNWPCSF